MQPTDRDTPKTLVIATGLPAPNVSNGGAMRSQALLRTLAQHGPVDLFLVGPQSLVQPDRSDPIVLPDNVSLIGTHPLAEGTGRAVPERRWLPGPIRRAEYRIRRAVAGLWPREDIVRKLGEATEGRDYAAVVCRYLTPAAQTEAWKLFPRARHVLDFDDVDWIRARSTIDEQEWTGWRARLTAKILLARLEKRAKRILKNFDAIWVTCEEDAEAILPHKSVVLPNLSFGENDGGNSIQSPARTSRKVLFVGDLSFGPNRKGLDHFIRSIWPKVRTAVDGAELEIVGRRPSDDDVHRWEASEGVRCVGFVDDLAEAYRGAAFTIAPIYFGGGTKIKVLESISFGRTVVTTPESARGYQAIVDEPSGIVLARDDEEFASRCVDLLLDPELREAMTHRAIEVVGSRFTRARFDEVVSLGLAVGSSRYEQTCQAST